MTRSFGRASQLAQAEENMGRAFRYTFGEPFLLCAAFVVDSSQTTGRFDSAEEV